MSEQTEIVLRPSIKKSPSIAALFKALAAAKKQYKPVVRTRENSYTGSKYADLQDLYDATQTALSDSGLTIIQFPIENLDSKHAGAYSMLGHESGEWVSVELMLPAEGKASGGVGKLDAQTIGAAITYASRYSYRGLAGVVGVDEDDDGNAVSQTETPHAPPKTKQAPPVNKAPAQTGGDRPGAKKTESVPPKTAEQPAPQSTAPPAAEPVPEPEKTQPSAQTAPETPASANDAIPEKTQFDAFCQRAMALKVPLEKAGLKPSKGVQTGAKLKNYLLKFAGVSELTQVTVGQWNNFFAHFDALTNEDAVKKIEEANQ